MNKYSDGKVKRTLKRRSKVLETVKRETNGTGPSVGSGTRTVLLAMRWETGIGRASNGPRTHPLRGGWGRSCPTSWWPKFFGEKDSSSHRRIPSAATGRRRIGRVDEGTTIRWVHRVFPNTMDCLQMVYPEGNFLFVASFRTEVEKRAQISAGNRLGGKD